MRLRTRQLGTTHGSELEKRTVRHEIYHKIGDSKASPARCGLLVVVLLGQFRYGLDLSTHTQVNLVRLSLSWDERGRALEREKERAVPKAFG